VTDAKRYERALVERNEALVTADRLKSRFIGHVSYELRTPLNSIIGFSELLAAPFTGDLNDKQREYLGDINSSSQTLLAIIDDILDLTTIDAGALELKLAPVDVKAVIDQAVLGVSERARRGARPAAWCSRCRTKASASRRTPRPACSTGSRAAHRASATAALASGYRSSRASSTCMAATSNCNRNRVTARA
jgi:signal transduction histidine kinase